MKNRNGLIMDTDARKYYMAMRFISKKAAPEAVAETLNRTADAVTKQQIKNVKRRLIVRTKYTIRSMYSNYAKPWMALNKAKGHDINRMYSRAGTFSKYLWTQDQEGGHVVDSKSGGPLPIPTLATRTSGSIRKSVRKKYRLNSSDSLSPGPVGDDKKKFIGVPKGGGRPFGLWERKNKNTRLVLLRNLEKDSVRLKDTNFHDDAVKKYGTIQFMRAQFFRVANRVLRRVK